MTRGIGRSAADAASGRSPKGGAAKASPAKPSVPNAEKIPFATHTGTVSIGGIVLRCHRLSDGSNVIEREGLEALFAAMAGGLEITERDAAIIAKLVHDA